MAAPQTPPPMTTARAVGGTATRSRATGDLVERPFEGRLGGVFEQPSEVLVGIGDEVHVERADALLEDAPHRLAEVGHDAHEAEAGEASGMRRVGLLAGLQE